MNDFPSQFLWGAATSAHQVEGNNVGSDWWSLEHRQPPIVTEPSGDACDSWHHFDQDLDLAAAAGLNCYRFSLEWSRIEPEPGEFSLATLAHYQRMVDGCRGRGLEPVVTLHHFTNPRWTRAFGGWESSSMVDAFRRYADFVVPRLRDVAVLCTINEPNMTATFVRPLRRGQLSDPLEPDPEISQFLVDAHHHAAGTAHTNGIGAGITVALTAYECADDPRAREHLERHRAIDEDVFLAAGTADAFIGVQAYTRRVVTPDGILPMGQDARGPAARTTLTGWTFAPDSVGDCLRRAHAVVPHVPLLVTENGIATADDDERIEYLEGALASVRAAMGDGVRVLGYIHWSLLDNFEWAHGYGPTFGLVAVDRATFARRPKPSLDWLGRVARGWGQTGDDAPGLGA